MRKRPSGGNPQEEYLKWSSYGFSKGAIVSETMLINLMRMLRAGPDVSLNGSPTVSPTTHASYHVFFMGCASETSAFLTLERPFVPSFSQYFFALSQAPPALDIMIATIAPLPMPPASMPTRQRGPTRKPTNNGARIAYAPGAIISLTLDLVEMATHLFESGMTSMCGGMGSPFDAMMMQSFRVVLPSCATRSGRLWNWSLTSMMISAAALPTEIIVRAANMYGSMAPKSMPDKT